jgi:hypothetical protein
MAKAHGPQIMDDQQYEALRRQGAGKAQAARIANTGRTTAARRGGKAPACADRTRDDPYQRAQELGIDQRLGMSKAELIAAIRNR